MIPHVRDFLKKRGIWYVLVQLYFTSNFQIGMPTPDNVERLKEIVGYTN
jgi:hypothetical protein